MNGCATPVAAGTAAPINIQPSERERVAVAAAMRRVQAILSAPDAQGANANMARYLALETDQPTDVVMGILKVAAASVTKTGARVDGDANQDFADYVVRARKGRH